MTHITTALLLGSLLAMPALAAKGAGGGRSEHASEQGMEQGKAWAGSKEAEQEMERVREKKAVKEKKTVRERKEMVEQEGKATQQGVMEQETVRERLKQ
jgi:hypothetical protein